jgi:hypothetical protein
MREEFKFTEVGVAARFVVSFYRDQSSKNRSVVELLFHSVAGILQSPAECDRCPIDCNTTTQRCICTPFRWKREGSEELAFSVRSPPISSFCCASIGIMISCSLITVADRAGDEQSRKSTYRSGSSRLGRCMMGLIVADVTGERCKANAINEQ